MQILAAQQIWPHVKVQICLWHIKKALKKHLADNIQSKIITYSFNSMHKAFDFINIDFYLIRTNEKKGKKDFYFCSQTL